MLDVFRTHPVAAVATLFTLLALSVLAFAIGWFVLYWIIRALTWLVPQLAAAALKAYQALLGWW